MTALPAHCAPAPAALSVEWYAAEALTVDDWGRFDAVAARAADANPFARAVLLRGAIDAGLGEAPAQIADIRNGVGETIAMFVLGCQRRHGRAPVTTVTAWSHPNGLMPPIALAPGYETSAWSALLDALAERIGATQACIADLPTESATARGLEAALLLRRLPLRIENAHRRAMIDSDLTADAYWEQAVRGKKRKELRRLWSRLQELGAVAVDLEVERHGAGWIDRFLALEAAGWKGAAGSALASAPTTRSFCRAALSGVHDAGRVAVSAITLDGRDIAMLVTLIEGDEAFTFKTAYDEEFARFSPGVLIQRESLPRLMHYARVDSLAVADHPMIDSLWCERRAVASYVFPLPRPAARLAFHAADAATRAWHAAKTLRFARTRSPT